MLVRAIALSLALLVGIGVLIPLSTNDVEAGQRHRKQRRHVKKYSKKWWRQYRARQRRKRVSRARARNLRLRQIRLARAKSTGQGRSVAVAKASTPRTKTTLPSGDKAPSGWSESQATPGELRFRVDDSAGSQVGSASISVVGPATGDNNNIGANKTLGGVAVTALRRDVINRMIQENGWVVNDYQKAINGRQVYVVVAQSQAKTGQVQSRMYYFTEVDGRIYNVATSSSADQADRLAEESEKVLASIQNRLRTTQRAAVRND